MRTKDFVAKLDHERIVRAIAAAEQQTSGEIRVFVQHGEVADAIEAAQGRFEKLGMTATSERNGVLIFVAPRSQKFPLASGTVHVDTPSGFVSVVTSKICSICLLS